MNIKFDAIILAAGRGKRMKPFSDMISKPMLPLLNKPLISVIVEQLLTLGADKIIITVSKSNEHEIKNYFQAQIYAEKVSFCLQDPPKGTAEAIYKAGLLCTADVIYSMAGDNLFSDSFCKSMVTEFFNDKTNLQCIMALMQVTKEEITKLASVTITETGYITNIVEKPDISNVRSTLASLSMYIFEKTLLNYFGSVPLSSRGEFEAPDAFLAMMNEKKPIMIKGLVTKEKYIHMSNPIDLYHFNMKYLKDDKSLVAEEVIISKNSTIRHSIIGKKSIIEKNCLIENSLILENTRIPANSVIKESIVGPSESGYEIVRITKVL